MKTIDVAYGGFETEQCVDDCLYNAIYNKGITDFVSVLTRRLTDAIHSKDVGSVRNLINEISEQLKDGEKHD